MGRIGMGHGREQPAFFQQPRIRQLGAAAPLGLGERLQAGALRQGGAGQRVAAAVLADAAHVAAVVADGADAAGTVVVEELDQSHGSGRGRHIERCRMVRSRQITS
jgi:hypothetical protein